MSVRAALAAVGCAALLAATAVVLGPIAPAQAAGSCSLIVPATLAVSRPYQAVILKLSADCAARQSGGWAAWDAYHPTKGYQEMAFFNGTTQEYWDIYDYGTPLGVWTWRASSCYDGNSDLCLQNSPRTTIKAGSQLGLTGTRAGSYRTLSVATAYYSPAASVYRMWGNEKVQLQYKTCATCTWTYLRNVYTASNGRATYRTYSAHLRYYRAVSASNSSIWGRTSAVILR